MSKKASNALIKLKVNRNTKLKPDVSMKLFDQLITPVALYGSETWRLDIVRFSTEEGSKFSKSLHRITRERLKSAFSRFLLGITIHISSGWMGVHTSRDWYCSKYSNVSETSTKIHYKSTLEEVFKLNTNLLGGTGWVEKYQYLEHYVSRKQMYSQQWMNRRQCLTTDVLSEQDEQTTVSHNRAQYMLSKTHPV